MRYLIEVSDTDERGALAFDLRDLLPLLPSEMRSFLWAVLELDAVSDESISMRQIEERIAISPHGYQICWNELEALASSLRQTINCVVVGYTDPDHPPCLPISEQLYESSELVIQAVDSTFWQVVARESEWLDGIAARFSGTVRKVLGNSKTVE